MSSDQKSVSFKQRLCSCGFNSSLIAVCRSFDTISASPNWKKKLNTKRTFSV